MFDMNKYLIDLETNPISSTSMGDLGKSTCYRDSYYSIYLYILY